MGLEQAGDAIAWAKSEEQLFGRAITDAFGSFMAGIKPDLATVNRWARFGVKRGNGVVRLQHWQVGRRLFSTRQAVERFILAINAGREQREPSSAAA